MATAVVEELEQHALEGQLPDEQPAEDLAALVSRQLERLGEPPVAPDVFRDNVQRQLDEGDFVFLYVARDLSERTRAVMTYLADGARLSFFTVEMSATATAAPSSCPGPRSCRRG